MKIMIVISRHVVGQAFRSSSQFEQGVANRPSMRPRQVDGFCRGGGASADLQSHVFQRHAPKVSDHGIIVDDKDAVPQMPEGMIDVHAAITLMSWTFALQPYLHVIAGSRFRFLREPLCSAGI